MMALDNYFLLPHQVQTCFDWDPHTFAPAADHQLHEHCVSSGVIPATAVGSPSMSSEASTGYLQDAVAECSERCKRRRLASPSPPPPPQPPPVHDSVMAEDLQGLVQGFWNPDFCEDPLGNSSYMLQDHIIIPDSEDPFSMPLNSKTQVTSPQPQRDPLPSSFSSPEESPPSNELSGKDDHHHHHHHHHCSTLHSSSPPPISSTVEAVLVPKGCGRRLPQQQQKKKKKRAMGVVYPFAVVKPGGFEGDVTLADINAKILMRPKRPVRHPVGEYACTPCAAGRPGLSGKAVVSLTRIHTQGSGTITIIRTRG